MNGSRQTCPNNSVSAPRLLPSAGMRNTALPPLPWSGLTTRSPGWRSVERADILDPARHQRRRHELGEIEHEHLFGRIAHAFGVVDDQRAPLEFLQEMRAGDIAQIERRVLPHQHDIDIVCKVELRKVAQRDMIALNPLHGERRRPARHPAFVPRQRADIVIPQQMPARLCTQQQREGRIAGDVDRLDRIHLDSDTQGHRYELSFTGIQALAMWRGQRCGASSKTSMRMASPGRQ